MRPRHPHTPRQLAEAHCANWDHGKCQGIVFDDNGAITKCHSKPRCVLGQPGITCASFDECVAPQAESRPDSAQWEAFREGLETYRIAAKQTPRNQQIQPLMDNDLSALKSCARCHDPIAGFKATKRLRTQTSEPVGNEGGGRND